MVLAMTAHPFEGMASETGHTSVINLALDVLRGETAICDWRVLIGIARGFAPRFGDLPKRRFEPPDFVYCLGKGVTRLRELE